MREKELFAIGHITNDLEPTPHLALKLMGIGEAQRGVSALPTLDQIKDYIEQNKERFKAFLKNNGQESLTLDHEES